MSYKSPQTFYTALAMLVFAPIVLAQAPEQGFSVGLNVHAGIQAISRRESLSPAHFGFGLELGFTTDSGKYTAEAGFLYKPGTQGLVSPSDMPLAPTAVITPETSKDSRKNQVDGLMLRLGYEKPLGSISLRAGLEFMGARFRQEYIADVSGYNSENWFRDTYNGVLNKTQIAVNPFIGISIPVDADQTFQVTLKTFSYTAINYVHIAGTEANTDGLHTTQDYTRETKRILPQLEFSYGFRF